MKAFKVLFVISIICIILFAGSGYDTVSAGKTHDWSTDEKVPGYLDDTFTPFLLADQNRTVHAFASQWVENNGRRLAIVYRQWTLLGGWTRPVDIILSPVGGNANFLGAYLDSFDRVHVIFSAAGLQGVAVYYSSAPAASAQWAPAWSAPMMVGWHALGLNSADIIGDDQGNLIIIYSGGGDGNGVYYVHSKDSGKLWSEALPVFLTYDTNLSPFSLRLTMGTERKIRATWSVVTNLGVDESLYFSSFDLEQSNWGVPVELDRKIDLPDYFGPSFPAIVDNGQDVVIFYNGGNPFTGRPVEAGRPIQLVYISKNGGISWDEPLAPFPLHVGRSGENALVLDGSGIPHALFIQRIEPLNESGEYSIIRGIWHSVFQNGVWTNPDRIVTSLPAHDVRAVVVQGNVLLTVWREDPGYGADGIWYSYSVLDVPELPVKPLATISVDYSVQELDMVVPNPSTPEPLLHTELLDDAPTSTLMNNPALPIIIGIIPVILILIGAVLGYRFLISRRE